MKLYVVNKGYSSWSQRAWLVLQHFELPFTDEVIPMYMPGSKAAVRKASPSGKMPVLVDGDVIVWETVSIIEYLAEKYPDKAIWPRDAKARAHARSASAEMHAGFLALRQNYPSTWRKTFPWRVRGGDAALADAARVVELWREARARFGAGGAFLYGAFSAADAMFAPVVARFHSYSFPVEDDTRAYMEAVRALPAHRLWVEQGQAEPWSIHHYDHPAD